MTVSTTQRFSLLFFLIISAITLVFGLKPHGNFKAEWVTTGTSSNSGFGAYTNPAHSDAFVEIGEYGYLQGDFPEFSNPIPNNESLDFLFSVTAQEQLDSKFRILLFIGESCESNPMIVGQWRTQLIVFQGCDFRNRSKSPRLTTALDEHFGIPTEVVISLKDDSSQLRINNSEVASNPVSIVNPVDTEGSLMLIGNSTNSRNGWSGLIYHFGIQRQRNQGDTTNKDITVLQNYTFSNPTQPNAFTSNASTQHQLAIPMIGKFPETVALERSPINRLVQNAKKDLIVNFLGFIPFGIVSAMCLYYCLGFRGLVLIALSVSGAFILSLGIELSQVYIAGRRSALHDLTLNTTGSIPGAVMFVLFTKLRERVSQSSLVDIITRKTTDNG